MLPPATWLLGISPINLFRACTSCSYPLRFLRTLFFAAFAWNNPAAKQLSCGNVNDYSGDLQWTRATVVCSESLSRALPAAERRSAGWVGPVVITGKAYRQGGESNRFLVMEKETQEDEHHGDEAQGSGNLCQHQVFKIAVFVILEGCARNHAVGKRVGVFDHDAVFGDVVVPVGRLVVIQQHDRRYGEIDP